MSNENKPEPVYCNGLIIRERVFENGGSQLNVSINIAAFKAFLDGNCKKEWGNIIIKKKRNSDPKSGSHYAVLDAWEPNKGQQSRTAASREYSKSNPAPVTQQGQADLDKAEDDVPF